MDRLASHLGGASASYHNKKSPWGINPGRCSSSPRGVKDIMVTQDTSSSLCSKRRPEYLFGRGKTGGLGQGTTKKNYNNGKKTGITRPRPDGGAKIFPLGVAIGSACGTNAVLVP